MLHVRLNTQRRTTSKHDVCILSELYVRDSHHDPGFHESLLGLTCRTCVIPRACSTFRSLSAATDPMKSPGLIQEGISLRAGPSFDSSSLDERWDDALLSGSAGSWDQPRLNSPPVTRPHHYCRPQDTTLQVIYRQIRFECSRS